jgi:hypothetical protein
MIIMAKITDTIDDDGYSSHVQKAILLNSEGLIQGASTEITNLVIDKELSTSYTTFGSVETSGYKNLILYIDADVNDSENVTLTYTTMLGTDEYVIDGLDTVTLWTTGASDFKKVYLIDVEKVENVVLKSKCETLGAHKEI